MKASGHSVKSSIIYNQGCGSLGVKRGYNRETFILEKSITHLLDNNYTPEMDTRSPSWFVKKINK
jgi:hypothetical protein